MTDTPIEPKTRKPATASDVTALFAELTPPAVEEAKADPYQREREQIAENIEEEIAALASNLQSWIGKSADLDALAAAARSLKTVRQRAVRAAHGLRDRDITLPPSPLVG